MEIFVMLIYLLKIKIFPKINKIVLLKFQKNKEETYFFLNLFSCKSTEEGKEYNLQNDSKMININLKEYWEET